MVWLLILLSIASLSKSLLRRIGRTLLRYNLIVLPAAAPVALSSVIAVIGDLLMDVIYACAIIAAVSRTTRYACFIYIVVYM